MSDSLIDLVLSLIPEDGSSIGNDAMLALLRDRLPDLSDDEYFAARDALLSLSDLPGDFEYTGLTFIGPAGWLAASV